MRDRFPELFKKTMSEIAETEGLYASLVTLTSLTKPEKEDLERVLNLAQKEKINPNTLRTFAWGSVLVDHEPETIIWLAEEIGKLESASPMVVLEILLMYCYRNENKFQVCRESFRQLILSSGVLLEATKSDTHDGYNWKQIVQKMLNEKPKDNELAQHLATEIVAACAEKRFELKFDMLLSPVLKILLEKYLDVTWPIFSKGFLSTESGLSYNLSHIFYFRLDSMDSSSILLDTVPEDFLIKWCKEYPDKAPIVLLHLIPSLRNQGDKWEFQPIVRLILDKYGNRKEILSAIDSMLGSYSWSGSIIPYYRRQVDVFETVLSHDSPLVRNWAKKNIEYLNEQIRKEEQWEGEREAGIY